MQPAPLAFLTCALSLIAAHGAAAISMMLEAIPWCFPYWDGCISISRAARSSDAIFWFRGLMFLQASFSIIFWWYCYKFIQFNASLPENRRSATGKSSSIMMMMGIVGALTLILYVNFLGTGEGYYRLMRRIGVSLYFGLTLLAQIIYLRLLAQIPSISTRYRNLIRMKLLNCILLLALGITNLTASVLIEDNDRIENRIEWLFALLMTFYFGYSAALWKHERFRIAFSTATK